MNTKNKTLILDKHMNNTINKIEERRFQEERRDVMKMNKFFTGLVAFMAGFALSAGSALATKGYLAGDSATMKVIPHFEIGDTKATIIGIANLESGDMDAMECYPAAATPFAGDYGTLVDTCGVTVGAATDSPAPDLLTTDPNVEMMANAMANANDPMNLILTVNIHGGDMMVSEQLCLEEHQFGYIVLQYGSAMAGQEIPHRGVVVSMMDNDAPRYGYVTISAMARIDECEKGYVTPDEMVMMDDAVMPAITTWAIVQDVSENGFFGTEVPTSTISMMPDDPATMGVDESTLSHSCYVAHDNNANGQMTDDGEAAGVFKQMLCGLIPERHNNTRMADAPETSTNEAMNANPASASPRAHVTTRYDIGADSTVFVWLGDSPSAPLEISVICEEGLPTAIDDPSSNVPTSDLPMAEIAVSKGTTMIDPSMGEVGDFADMCEGDRGVLSFQMPHGSGAGMVWTHVTQGMSHFRMNFPGYSMASPTSCNNSVLAYDTGAERTAAATAVCQ